MSIEKNSFCDHLSSEPLVATKPQLNIETQSMSGILNRKRTGWTFAILGFLFVAFVAYAVVVPSINAILHSCFYEQQPKYRSATPLVEQIYMRASAFLASSLAFVLGACLGSFANVVVWRMPQGKSVLSRSSFCPRCNERIKLRDNIPVLGWVKLGGRCRQCKLPISPRYPIVEALFGFVFLFLFLVECSTGAANIPGTIEYSLSSKDNLIWLLKPETIGLYFFHCFVVSSLIILSLIRLDGNQVPSRLITFLLLPGLVSIIGLPALQPVSYSGVSPSNELTTLRPKANSFRWMALFLTPALGAVIGLALAGLYRVFTLTSSLGNTDQQVRDWTAVWFAGCFIGLTLGWQAVASVFCIFGLIVVIAVSTRGVFGFDLNPIRVTPCLLTVSTLIHLIFWQGFTSVPWWPSDTPGLLPIGNAILITTVAFLVFRRSTKILLSDPVSE